MRLQMLSTHLFCAAVLFFTQFTNEKWFNILTLLSIMAMAAQVLNITSISQYLFTSIEPGQTSTTFNEFVNWLRTEIVVFAAVLASNIAFLVLRSFTIERITLTVTNLRLGVNSDYLESSILLTALISTCVVPTFLLLLITHRAEADDFSLACAQTWLPWSLVQTFSIYFLVFVPWIRSPLGETYDDVWSTYVPFIHGLLAILTFVAIPIYFIVDGLVNRPSILASEFSS